MRYKNNNLLNYTFICFNDKHFANELYIFFISQK